MRYTFLKIMIDFFNITLETSYEDFYNYFLFKIILFIFDFEFEKIFIQKIITYFLFFQCLVRRVRCLWKFCASMVIRILLVHINISNSHNSIFRHSVNKVYKNLLTIFNFFKIIFFYQIINPKNILINKLIDSDTLEEKNYRKVN